MDSIDNNQFEVKPNSKTKRKFATPCSTAYHNPALDLLVNEDPMCNNAMEIEPVKKRKRTRSCEISAFENTALDVGVSKAAVNKFLVRELENVYKNIKPIDSSLPIDIKENVPHTEPIYANLTDMSILPCNNTENSLVVATLQNTQDLTSDLSRQYAPITSNAVAANDIKEDSLAIPFSSQCEDSISTQNCMDLSEIQPDMSRDIDSGISVLDQKSLNTVTINETDDLNISNMNTTNIQTNVTNQIFINNTSNLNLSFIDRLALNSPNLSDQSLYLDDDLNESNIMEIKTITIITKKKRIPERKKITNPFLDPNLNTNCPIPVQNPFLDNEVKEIEYNDEMMNKPAEIQVPQSNLMPRRLFTDTNSTISTVNESLNVENHEYENVDSYRAESPIYENVSGELNDTCYNKQSKILGCDVSQFSAIDIMNLNRNRQANNSNDSAETKKDLKHAILKASNKLSKKVFKTLKKKFKGEKPDQNVSLNPYEVPRKPPKQKLDSTDSGIENPALNLDNSDEIEIEELDEDDDVEHQYETIKTIRNTRLNMNVTPLKERVPDNIDTTHNRTNTPGKKVRFDSTLNQEKVITGNSFDYGLQSPGFDSKIEKYHDELENCINERKFLQQNM